MHGPGCASLIRSGLPVQAQTARTSRKEEERASGQTDVLPEAYELGPARVGVAVDRPIGMANRRCTERGWVPDARQKRPGAARFALLQADASVIGHLDAGSFGAEKPNPIGSLLPDVTFRQLRTCRRGALGSKRATSDPAPLACSPNRGDFADWCRQVASGMKSPGQGRGAQLAVWDRI
jgi:hypothetical protein